MDKLKKLIREALGAPVKIGCACGCNSCGNAPILNESKQYDYAISMNMRYHIYNKIPLHDSVLPLPQRQKLINEAKLLVKKDMIKVFGKDEKFINENSAEKLYKIQGLLVTNNKLKTQAEALSDIRSITGVTIVSNREYTPNTPKKGYQYGIATVKIDPYPYLKNDGKFDIETVNQVIQQIKNIKGVVVYKAEPKLINIGI